MANTIKCGQCMFFYELKKPKPKGGMRSLGYGHCLDRTVYAKGKPGNPVYPPGAKVADMPFDQHNVTVVKPMQLVPHCLAAKLKE